MPISIIDNFDVNAPKNIDGRLGPYDTTASAILAIDETTQRYLGLTVVVTGSGTLEEYWFQNGVTDSDLVLKSSGISPSQTGSFLTTASAEFSEVTFTKGDASTFLIDTTPRQVIETVKNLETGTLPKGTPVYASGSTGNAIHVYAASSSRSDRMPAAYVLGENLTSGQEGIGILTGFINGVDTSAFASGDVVYVGAEGGYTNIKPTGSNLIQNLGKVTISAVNGSGVISGAGRANDVPNITPGYFWLGNSDSVATPTATSSIQNVVSSSYATTASYALGGVVPTLQQVTDEGNTTTNGITLSNSNLTVSGSIQLSGSNDITIDPNATNAIKVVNTDNFGGEFLLFEKSNGLDMAIMGSAGAETYLKLFDNGGNSIYLSSKQTSNSYHLPNLAIGSNSADSNNTLSVTGNIKATTNITASGGISASGNLFASASDGTGISHVALYNTSSGQFFYTASSAIGGTTPTLQQVTDEGATTTNDIQITGSLIVSGSFIPHGNGVLSNTVIGENAGASLESGATNNIIIGKNAANGLTTGDDNITIGYHAGKRDTNTESNNLFIGSYAGEFADHAQTVAIGNYTSRYGNGSYNVYLGYGAATGHSGDTSTHSYNTIIGSNTAVAIANAINNTSIGYNSLNSLTSGNNNIAIGYAAGKNITTGNSNIIIGSGSLGSTALEQQLRIGHAGVITISASLSTGHVILSGSTGGLELIGSGSTLFEVIGSEGTLFSVDDDLDGTIFTANDRSGLPVLEASASGEVYIGKSPQSLYTTAVISSTTAATTQSIYGLSTSSYGGAFFDYTVQSGSNARAGSIMSVWNGSNISFTETTTTDIGDTTDFNVIVHISQSQAQIASHATKAGYNIKTIIRSI